ncbi:MAG: contractile injection system protein, VgrG/Pvc8 family [Acidaminobacteraceae bacterium]
MGKFEVGSDKLNVMKIMDKYNNMAVPSVQVMIEGKDIANKSFMAVNNVSVETSTEKADICTFEVLNAYDVEKLEFAWVDKDFTPGKKVEIKFGYVDILTTVFEGFITAVTCAIRSDETIVHVTCMDKSFAMMKCQKSRIWTEKKHSDIVGDISGSYGLSSKVSATQLDYASISQNDLSDYKFINLLADYNGFEFFVTGSTLYFRDRSKDLSSAILLTVGTDVASFEYTIDIGEQIAAIDVKGYGLEKKLIKGKATSVTKLGNQMDGVSIIKKLIGENSVKELNGSFFSDKDAEIFAKGQLQKQSQKFVRAKAEVIGIPELRAGRFISIKGMWATKEKLFYIKNCQHTMDEEGYSTRLDLEGNSI